MRARNPALTVDAIVPMGQGRIVLIRRGNEPFLGCWALPGGFVEIGERVEDACLRELEEETGLQGAIRGLIGVFSDPNRDPRGHTVSIAYAVDMVGGELRGGDDAAEASAVRYDDSLEMAFDHREIIKLAIRNGHIRLD
ncbi:MAG: NUDIX hydrolase [bacterium]